MLDEVAIQQTLNRFSEGASRRDWAQVTATLTPDGIWEVPAVGIRCEGRAAIQETMVGVVAPYAYVVQANSPAVINVTGDKATARTVIRECAKYADREEAMEILGVYSDDLVRTAEGWQIAHRRLEVLGMHTFKVQPPALPA